MGKDSTRHKKAYLRLSRRGFNFKNEDKDVLGSAMIERGERA